MQPTTIHDEVREYYGHVLGGSDDLKTNAACCSTDTPPKYVLDVMPLIADEIIARFYGCGSPIPPALEGATVLDLGCGTGRDVYVLSKLVGPTGRVIGVDMTEEQLAVARKYQQEQAERFGFAESNVEFKLGYIEDLASAGIADESIDLVVSNCVVNLSPFKDKVFAEIFRVLKPGGELYFSDVYSDRRIPDELRRDPVLVGECLGGALYLEDFRRKMAAAGWPHYAFTVVDDIHVSDLAVETKVGFMTFTSRTVRAIKCEGLEPTEEDYGQQATYLGGMPEMPRYFDFDSELRFVKGKPRAISGNTARMLAASRYGRFFDIAPEGPHRGTFHADRAQKALDVRMGKRAVDARMLDEAYEALGYCTFEERVGEPSLLRTRVGEMETMQVNITYACNLGCRHCYLECGPRSTETMSRETMEACLAAFKAGGFKVMDITGGSPEMHPDFECFVREAAKLGDVIVRSNLTLLTVPKCAHLADVLAECGAQVVGSLPFYNGDGTDNQRGKGVFERAIAGVRALNERGYGSGEQGMQDCSCPKPLKLDLVYNVSGPFLPPPQDMVEEAYKVVLEREQGVRFDNLLAFNNYAIGRFAHDLLDAGLFEGYLSLLADNFNAMAVTRMMCLNQVNVDYDGRLYDCEVNHVLRLPIQLDGRDATVRDLLDGPLPERAVRTHPVCYSCTAGSGSSCGGSLVPLV
ncbi:MAG: arsenosugar biosynthesis radical SAM protein ArsS [Eggerthellaceae bacterium]|nr:arsenosugar biosynthesis radical SAM protein ArsS [Eggerthellaceae bacterium]